MQWYDTTLALHRFEDEGRDIAAGDLCGDGAGIVGTDMADRGQHRFQAAAVARAPGGAERTQALAVVSALDRHDAPATGSQPGHLQYRLHRVGTVLSEPHPPQAGRSQQVDETGGESGGRGVGQHPGGRAHPGQLRVYRGDHVRVLVAEQSDCVGTEVQHLPAVGQPDHRAVRADFHRAAPGDLLTEREAGWEVGARLPQAGGGQVRVRVHEARTARSKFTLWPSTALPTPSSHTSKAGGW